MHAERTPNPDSVKWVLEERAVLEGGGFADFADLASPETSPLATRLLSIDGVTRVLLGPDFVTVSKRDTTLWSDLAEPVARAIGAWNDAEEPALGADYVAARRAGEAGVVARIRELIEREIAPYVAQDGGEIALAGYANGVVEVHLRGACAGCPSSSVTLKLGIEARLREEIPEVQAVVAV